MNPKTLERSSEIACNLVMTVLSLALVAGYLCLYHVFQADRQEGRAVAMEQKAAVPEAEQLTYQNAE
jgi:hypothetical protein